MAKVLLDALAGLQRALSGDEPLGPRLDRAAELAARIVPGCAAAGITVGAEGRAATVGHRGTPAALLDQVQYDSDRGPCLDAFRSGQVVEVPSIAGAGATWP